MYTKLDSFSAGIINLYNTNTTRLYKNLFSSKSRNSTSTSFSRQNCPPTFLARVLLAGKRMYFDEIAVAATTNLY